MTETELKFELDEAAVKSIKARIKTVLDHATKPVNRTLTSVYFDTADSDLYQSGIVLRLRREGRRWTQSLKIRLEVHGGLARAEPIECHAIGGRLDIEGFADADVRHRIHAIVGDKLLLPIFRTVVRRMSVPIPLRDGGQAEIAVDQCIFTTESYSAPLREVEFKLTSGSVRALFDLAHSVLDGIPVRFAHATRSARGNLLAEQGRIDRVTGPRKAIMVPISLGWSAERAAQDVFRECFSQIALNLDLVAVSDDPAGPHQLRVGLRRLRSAFSLFAPSMKNAEMKRLSDEAKWMGQVVGALRDFDVIVHDILDPEIRLHPQDGGFAALRGELEMRVDATRAAVRAELCGRRAQAFLIDLACFIETRGWLIEADIGQTMRLAEPVMETARAALDTRWRSVCKKARHCDDLDVEGRHDWRKELKKLRYAVEFMSPLFPKRRLGTYSKHLRDLQDVFGDLNDATMLERLLADDQQIELADRNSLRAAGWLIGSRSSKAELAWPKARSNWNSLKAEGPFWS